MQHADLPDDVWQAIVADGRSAAPFESCGLIAAGPDGRPLRYHRMRNAAGRLDWFEPDPRDLLRLTMAMDDAGQSLWAICHSHPRSPARPSESDIEGAAYPDALYIICSLAEAEPDVRAYHIADGRSEHVPLRRVPRVAGPAEPSD